MVRPSFVALCAAAAYVSGVFDKPWARRMSGWTYAAVVTCVALRVRGHRGPSLLALAVEGPQATRAGLLARDVVGVAMIAWVTRVLVRMRRVTAREVKLGLSRRAIDVASLVPAVQRRMASEFAKVEKDMKSMKPTGGLAELPELSLGSNREIASRLVEQGKREDAKWQAGKVSGAVYNGEVEHIELMNAAMAAYAVANPLHADVWPSLNRMEGEVISMAARLVDGGHSSVCGAITSGGTESILLAAKTHRDKARFERGVERGEIVACVTAHAGIDKACDLLGMRLVKVPAVDFRIDVRAVARAITADTVALYASAPSFPQGTIDDVVTMASIASSYGIGLHVDCCLGGFILPFVESPPFDFRLDGVTSMSLDTHKYGYAPKGTSVVLYRNKDFRKYQYFCYPDWTGGLYATPTVAGSRNGALIAATWASLVSKGRRQLATMAQDIVATANAIAKGIPDVPRLRLLGAKCDNSVDAMIVCFTSDDLNIYAINDNMVQRGWSLNALQHPPSIHLCCTYRTVPHVQLFLDDLRAAVASVAASPRSDAVEGSAAIYGMASSMPAGPVTTVLQIYTDIQLDN